MNTHPQDFYFHWSGSVIAAIEIMFQNNLISFQETAAPSLLVTIDKKIDTHNYFLNQLLIAKIQIMVSKEENMEDVKKFSNNVFNNYLKLIPGAQKCSVMI